MDFLPSEGSKMGEQATEDGNQAWENYRGKTDDKSILTPAKELQEQENEANRELARASENPNG
jgi:hypothetical protein